MKKIIVILSVFVLIFMFNDKKDKTIKIPDSAIRYRILANSNSPRDQKIKQDINVKLQEQLKLILKDTNSVLEAKKVLKENINILDNTLEKETENLEYSYSIDYGIHYFPKKEFKGVTYDDGYYESLLVTLGNGSGDNFWCVLFPPFCILEAEESDTNDVEYKFFIKELIEKYF